MFMVVKTYNFVIEGVSSQNLILGLCLGVLSLLVARCVLINDQSDYKKYSICDSNPTVDFTKHFIIGYKTTGQCTLNNIRKITDDINLRRYIYDITVVDSGICKSLVIDMNWVVVTNFPEGGYSIQVISHN